MSAWSSRSGRHTTASMLRSPSFYTIPNRDGAAPDRWASACNRTRLLSAWRGTATRSTSGSPESPRATKPLLAVPLEFLACLGDDEDGLDAVHLLRRAGIDRGDAGVAVRAGEVHREQHVLHLEVGGVLGAPRGFLRAVQALEGLTD